MNFTAWVGLRISISNKFPLDNYPIGLVNTLQEPSVKSYWEIDQSEIIIHKCDSDSKLRWLELQYWSMHNSAHKF